MSTTSTITATESQDPISIPTFKWTSLSKPAMDFVPPKDQEIPETLVSVPLNPKGPTELPYKTKRDYTKEDYKWKEYLPYNTLSKDPALGPYEHVDAASRADPEKKALFETIKDRKDMTPAIGTEVWNAQLSQLTPKQKDELALYVAERGLVVFRKQDFCSKGADFMKEYGSHFGPLHVHQFGQHVKGSPELVIVFRDDEKTYLDNAVSGSLSTTRWHSDMTYELNPPATTFLCSLSTPECGGDTLYMNAMAAYDALSKPMQEFVEGLSAVHAGTPQTMMASKTNLVRRPALDTIHPVVRKHPVTGRKALWVNHAYVTKIVGLKEEESDVILKMLLDHIAKGLDFHTRVKWEEDSVVVYDNRMVQHSIVLDYPLGEGGRRHLIRVTPQGERPAL